MRSVASESPQVSRRWSEAGLTLVELLLVVALLGTLSVLAAPAFVSYLGRIKIDKAIVDIRLLAADIKIYEDANGIWPSSLADLGRPVLPLDPWGHPFQYLPSTDTKWKGMARKDRFLVPLNSDFDLYSLGPDGESRSPLTARQSRDDIVRASDGGFVGPAADF